MKKRYYIPIAFLLLSASAILAVVLLHSPSKRTMNDVPVGVMNDGLKQRGEELLKRRMYAPLIETYKRMLMEYPESIDLKKKLAFAYFSSGDYADARPLLEEVSRTEFSDDEVRRELDFIKALK